MPFPGSQPEEFFYGDDSLDSEFLNSVADAGQMARGLLGEVVHDAGTHQVIEGPVEELFVAKLTEKAYLTMPSSGSGSSGSGSSGSSGCTFGTEVSSSGAATCMIPVYGWVEMSPRFDGPGYFVKEGGRSGTVAMNPAVPFSGRDVQITHPGDDDRPVLVWMRERIYTNGHGLSYEFEDTSPVSAPAGVDFVYLSDENPDDNGFYAAHVQTYHTDGHFWTNGEDPILVGAPHADEDLLLEFRYPARFVGNSADGSQIPMYRALFGHKLVSMLTCVSNYGSGMTPPGEAVATDCCPNAIRKHLKIDITATGTCSCLNATGVDLRHVAGSSWQGTYTSTCAGSVEVFVICTKGEWRLLLTCVFNQMDDGNIIPIRRTIIHLVADFATSTCLPLSLKFAGGPTDSTDCCGGDGTVAATVTESTDVAPDGVPLQNRAMNLWLPGVVEDGDECVAVYDCDCPSSGSSGSSGGGGSYPGGVVTPPIGGGGPGSCTCDYNCGWTGTPMSWGFTLSGIGDGTCPGCSIFNQDVCLEESSPCFYSAYVSDVGVGYLLFCNDTEDEGNFLIWSLQIVCSSNLDDDHNTAYLCLSRNNEAGTLGHGGSCIVKYIGPWHRCDGNTNTLDKTFDSGECTGWPNSITLEPNCFVPIFPGNGEHDCATCNPATFHVKFGYVTDGTCTGCTILSGQTYVLPAFGLCTWATPGPGITCGGVGASGTILVRDIGTEWIAELVYGGVMVQYEHQYLGWDCTGIGWNRMTRKSSDGSCNFPRVLYVKAV